MKENLFERFSIEPTADPAKITAQFRKLISRAKTAEEKDTLREAWKALTQHPEARVLQSVLAYPPIPEISRPVRKWPEAGALRARFSFGQALKAAACTTDETLGETEVEHAHALYFGPCDHADDPCFED